MKTLGRLSKLASILTGSSEADLIKARKAMLFKADSMMYPDLAEQLIQTIKMEYENSIDQIIDGLVKALKSEANLSDHGIQGVIESNFMKLYIDNFALDIFRNGYSIGYLMASKNYRKSDGDEFFIFMEDLKKKIDVGVMKYVMPNKSVVAAFYESLAIAGDLGSKAGVKYGSQEWVLVKKR